MGAGETSFLSCFLPRWGHLAVQKKGRHKRRPGGAWDRVGCGRRSSGCRCAFLSAFPFGVTVGYGWRSRISRMRRLRYLSRGRLRAEPDPGVTALARSDMRPATGQVAVASPSLSARATAVETGVPHATLPSLKKATRAGDHAACEFKCVAII